MNGAVLLREAIRSSRRWQTYALRVLVTGLFLLALGWTWNRMLAQDFDIARAGEWGHEMYRGWSTVQVVLAGLLAPVLVAMGVAEEKEDGTLELLALTRLTSTQILFGKATSRLLVMLTIVFAGMPMLGLISTLGGVAAHEIVGATLGTAVVVVVLGLMGGHLALYTRNAVAAAVGAWVYGFIVFCLCLFPYALLTQGLSVTRPWDLSPLFGLMAESWTVLYAPLAFVAPVIAILWLSVPVFRMATTTGDNYGEDLLSREIWAIERFSQHTWAVVLALFIGGPPLLWGVFALLAEFAPRNVEVAAVVGVSWLLGAACIYASTAVFLVGVRLFSGYLAARAEQQRLLDELREERVWRGSTERLRAWVLRRDGQVWGNPVAWRELATRSHGAARLGNRLGLAFLGVVVFSAWSCEGVDNDRINLAAGMLGLGFGALVMVLAATASIVEERRSGALPVLLSTTMKPWRIVWGKVLAVLAHGLPLVIPGALLLTAGVVQYWDSYYAHVYDSWQPYAWCGEHTISQGSALSKLVWSAAWASSVGFALLSMCLVVSMRLNPPRLAWAANIGIVATWLVGPLFLEEALIDVEWASWLRELVFPITIDGFGIPVCGVSPTFVASTALHAGIALVLLAWLTHRLRGWGTAR